MITTNRLSFTISTNIIIYKPMKLNIFNHQNPFILNIIDNDNLIKFIQKPLKIIYKFHLNLNA